MLNCKNCGAPLSLDEPVCAHCGTPNPEAQEHLKGLEEIAELDRMLDSTKEEIAGEIRKTRRGYSLLVVLAILLLANLVLIPFHSASYEIAERLVAGRTVQGDAQAALDDLLAQGDYMEFGMLADRLDLPYSEYRDYRMVAAMANDYSSVVEYTTLYRYSTDNYSDPLVRACRSILDFQNDYAGATRWEMGPEMAAHAERLNAEFQSFLQVYLGLTDGDLGTLGDLTESQLLVLVNARLADED